MNQKGINQCQIGMVGLGVMGRNLLLNMADHGFVVAGFDKDADKVASLKNESKEQGVYGASTLEDFLKLLKKPRAIMMLIPAGKPVDMVIDELLPYLDKGDLIIDGGNSHYIDTDVRAKRLENAGIQFLGVGISGGEEGARRGPSMMPGGPKEAYEKVRPILEAVSAKVNDEPCVTYLGTGSVGHFVKMVHNGIEYGIMQLIAEIYDLMKRGLNLSNDEMGKTFKSWNDAELNSYLVEITSHIFAKVDDKTHKKLVDEIVAVAQQNGTGLWTSQSAMELQVPDPTIDLAVAMRDLSVLVNDRKQANEFYKREIHALDVNKNDFLKKLKGALFTGMILTYAQGMSILTVASQKFNYRLDMEAVARIWRGGCIIRATLLEDFREAYRAKADLSSLLLDPKLAEKVMQYQEDLREVVCAGCKAGIPMPALTVSLGYFDAYRSAWQPANLIQAQRDYFGSHTYERIDAKGIFHTIWEKD